MVDVKQCRDKFFTSFRSDLNYQFVGVAILSSHCDIAIQLSKEEMT